MAHAQDPILSLGCISEWIWFAFIFLPTTKNTKKSCCSLREDFGGNITVFNVYEWRHRHKTHSCYSELNSLQNIYFGFLIFGKLTEWHTFVTCSSNDPRNCLVNREVRIGVWRFDSDFVVSIQQALQKSRLFNSDVVWMICRNFYN